MAAPLDYLINIDMHQNEVQNRRIQNLAVAPSSPVAGQEYYDTALGYARVWNGSAWAQSSGATLSSVGVSMPADFTVTSSPLTANGTIAVTYANQTGYKALARGTGTGVPSYQILDHNWISDFDTQVRTSRLDQMAAAGASVAMGGFKITGLANGTANSDGATYGQLLSLVNGASWKGAVACIARANVTLSGEQTIDGITTSTSRILVSAQTTGTQNGIYTTGAGAWVRTADLASGASASGAAVLIEGGTTYADTQWNCTNLLGSDVVGTAALTFVQFGAATSYVADESSLHLTGTTFSIKSTYVGQTSITTLGTITTGVWNGTAIAVANGGTGATTAAGARTNLGAVAKYIALIGDGSSTSIAITQATHGLSSNGQMQAQVFDATTGAWVICDIAIANGTGTVTFSFAIAPAANAYRFVLMG